MTGEFLIDGVDFKEMMDEANRTKAALAAEQREHGITRQQRDTLQTQCEDMQKELKESQTHIALDVAFMAANDECIKELNDELEAERKRNNAALKPSGNENVVSAIAQRDDKIEALEFTQAALCTEVSKLAGYKVELESSAETQARHMQQVDAACKAAEAKVIVQRKEIEALKSGEDLWICPSAHYCDDECGHHIAHPHNERCEYECRDAIGYCVKVNTCKECATMREEIINRDAVILEQERRAEDREEIINALAKEIKVMRAPETRPPMQPSGFVVMFSGKAGDMQTPNKKHQCKWYNVCAIASETSHACIANEGQHCGRKREIDAKHGVIQ